MAKFNITAPDGSKWTVNAPDGASDQEVLAYAQSQWKQPEPAQTNIAQDKPAEQDSNILGNIAAGAIRGAGSIGATLLTPLDYAARKMGIQNDFIGRTDRREAMDAGLQSMGADPSSLAYKGGKLGGEIAGTAGIGGALAKGVLALPKAIPAAAPFVPKVAAALQSGGFSLGGAPAKTMAGKVGEQLLRAGAGATVGGTQAGLVNPDDAGTGAVLGGAMPGAAKLAGEAGKLAKRGANALVRNTLGLSTGAGGDAISMAFQSGKAGNKSFLDNMRGKVSFEDVVDDLKGAIGNMKAERSAAYKSGMLDVGADKSIIDFAPIEKAMAKATGMGVYKGKVINDDALTTIQKMGNKIKEWATADKAEFHTPEGLDALKQAIGDIRLGTKPGTTERAAADSVYNAIKREIVDQAPVYSEVMGKYSEASQLIKEAEKAFSAGEKASADTTLRKLQSLMRNNVNTNYSNRTALAKTLEEKGGKQLLAPIAGQALSSPTPRGLQQLTMTGAGVYGLTNPLAWAAIPFQSPRLMGETAYGLGRAASGVTNAGNKAAARVGNAMSGLLTQDNAMLRTLPLLAISTNP